MKVKDLISKLQECDLEKEIVVQTNHGDGYFQLHDPAVHKYGHIGHDGVIIMLVPTKDKLERSQAV